MERRGHYQVHFFIPSPVIADQEDWKEEEPFYSLLVVLHPLEQQRQGTDP